MTGDGFSTALWPTDLHFDNARQVLTIRFEDGRDFHLPAELLRVESPSAEVQGHGPGQKTILSGKRHVRILALEPVGHYAVRLRFDDGHDSGIFTWRYLLELGENQTRLWAEYLAALARTGGSRDI